MTNTTGPASDYTSTDINFDMLAYDIADMLDRNEYPIDVTQDDVLEALPAFVAALRQLELRPASDASPSPSYIGHVPSAVGDTITGTCVTLGVTLTGRVVEVLHPPRYSGHSAPRYRITDTGQVHNGMPVESIVDRD